jgi:hypothetical protein
MDRQRADLDRSARARLGSDLGEGDLQPFKADRLGKRPEIAAGERLGIRKAELGTGDPIAQGNLVLDTFDVAAHHEAAHQTLARATAPVSSTICANLDLIAADTIERPFHL